ncbi:MULTISPECIES: GLPGLI family protein [Chryseobacterium]|uniref:GLPGLI family protein n=1 Tax=Chryseobacterium camelliae TaxID=1265445 RepID=A0ABU0TN99_9FLAO|nr:MULTISPECIES: GLPGLI family protein [Chryseobacterium]MDT3407879.1 GLPGLI family protein [Pseudacidovorax intermedius]MDQ1098266.1 GLPGLI family protein [Chryseobacterium camelliae]MDQ1102191.1 GLPGLI family protein [Chryseobacterium sp. SORGH_AS_1048]MDR6085629.1 GLPGLI family protein [Chryseobacterium sp. SORGH_AS_0909]MDR6129993.1 GLPGLI family protein [Chryseobacterium sp. SORGH_AS_1175]
MKKLFSILLIGLFTFGMAQDSKDAKETANRFFYELTFKPKKDSAKIEKVLTALDIVKDRSVYRDYTVIGQDSIIKVQVEAMQKSGVFKDMSKSIRMPKFSAKIVKHYPDMKIQYIERISSGFTTMAIAYNETPKFNWKILNEKEKIGAYNAQKATTEFGGRKWTAWFSTDLPFQDGPYKFSGLPGLIVKIEDEAKDYSWILQGNKKVPNWEELSFGEKISGMSLKVTEMPREKFEKTFNEFKKDPFATVRPMLTQDMMSKTIPGMDGTVGDMLKKQEKMYKDFFNSNDNPIEPPYQKLDVGQVEKVGKEKN